MFSPSNCDLDILIELSTISIDDSSDSCCFSDFPQLIIENRNLISDLDFYGEPNIEVVETETIKITYTSKNSYNKNSSIYNIDINADVEKNGNSFSLSHRESLRFLPPDEMIYFLKKAGFDTIKYLPDYREEKTAL